MRVGALDDEGGAEERGAEERAAKAEGNAKVPSIIFAEATHLRMRCSSLSKFKMVEREICF